MLALSYNVCIELSNNKAAQSVSRWYQVSSCISSTGANQLQVLSRRDKYKSMLSNIPLQFLRSQ